MYRVFPFQEKRLRAEQALFRLEHELEEERFPQACQAHPGSVFLENNGFLSLKRNGWKTSLFWVVISNMFLCSSLFGEIIQYD